MPSSLLASLVSLSGNGIQRPTCYPLPELPGGPPDDNGISNDWHGALPRALLDPFGDGLGYPGPYLASIEGKHPGSTHSTPILPRFVL